VHTASQAQTQMNSQTSEPSAVAANELPVIVQGIEFADQQPVVVSSYREGGDDEVEEDDVELEASMLYMPLVVLSPLMPGVAGSSPTRRCLLQAVTGEARTTGCGFTAARTSLRRRERTSAAPTNIKFDYSPVPLLPFPPAHPCFPPFILHIPCPYAASAKPFFHTPCTKKTALVALCHP